MTKFHQHDKNHRKFVESRVGSGNTSNHSLKLSRRDFLRGGAIIVSGALLPRFLSDLSPVDDVFGQEIAGKRIYIALDDHTDLFWTADVATYEKVFVETLDFYLDLADKTYNEPVDFQSRWNCDGSFWLWIYEKNKPRADFERLIERIRDGHISMPLNALCVCLGGTPAEAVLRGMYYPGKLERRYNLRFQLAYSMENQTLPFGLGALWSGSGATFSWKGICACASYVPDAGDREHDIYWWVGMDGSRILMKWNSLLVSNQSMGGYAEVRFPEEVINYVDTDENFKSRYPYQVIGAFGYGWDDLQSKTDQFVSIARKLSKQTFKVIVSNEIDFAQDFEKIYGNDIPSLSASFGNEWDLDCTTMVEVSARVKRAVEKLRSAESLATLTVQKNAYFMQDREAMRDQAWMNLGLFWEHDWQGAPWDGLTQKRMEWNRKIAGEIESYVNTLQDDALVSLGGMIEKSGMNERFFVFNPLNWVRTDYADYEYAKSGPVHVVDLENDQETPSQFVMKDGKRWLRILASDIPSIGYKVFEIRDGAGQSFSPAANVNENQIENQFIRVMISDRGAIVSLEDKTRANKQFAREFDGRFINDLGAGAGDLQIENEGPVTVTFLASVDTPLSRTSRITFLRNSDRIEIRNDIIQNFDATHTWGFGFALEEPDIHHEEVGAILRARLTNQGGHYSPRNARYDWLTLNHFVDISDNTESGVTISNSDCYFMKLGNSTVEQLDTQTPQISILVGGRDLNGSGILESQGGDSHFLQRFALKVHGRYDPVVSMKFALEHQNPFVVSEVRGGAGYPSNIYSLLEIDNSNVLLWAIKPADDGADAGTVIRLWNVSQERQDFFLRFGDGKIIKALNLTHIETPTGDAPLQDGRLTDSINSQQIKTYAVIVDQSGNSFITPAPAATATSANSVGATPAVEMDVMTPTNGIIPDGTSVPADGRGCLLGWLDALMVLLK